MQWQLLRAAALAAALGCGNSTNGTKSSDAGDAAAETDGTQSADSSSGSQESSDGRDSGSIQYATACGDGGGVPPAPVGQWTNATSNLAGVGSECGNMSNLSSKPDEDMLIAGIAQQGLWASTNGGSSWTRLGTGAASATITNRTSEIVYDPVTPQTFWESGIYNGGGVYKTTDDGTTLLQQGDVTHNDSVSIDFSDPQRQTLLAGTHEQSGHLFRSTDGGNTWTDIGPNLPTGSGYSTEPLVVNAQTYLLGTYTDSDTGGGLGIFRTIDSGQTWTQVFSPPVEGHPLVMSDGTIYWAIGSNGGVVKSVDTGVTWQITAGPGVVVSEPEAAGVIDLPDGRLAALGPNAVMVSADCGTTWHAASTALPYSPWGLVYSPYQKAFFVWQFDCTGAANPGDPVPADAIMRFNFDYETN